MASTCETAGHYYRYNVVTRWEAFQAAVQGATTAEAIVAAFPFHEYFADAPQPLFNGETAEANLEIAKGCMTHIDSIFKQLEEFRPFELLHKVYRFVIVLLILLVFIVIVYSWHYYN